MGTQLKQTDEIGEAKRNITCTKQGADKRKQEKQQRECEGHGETKTTSTQKGTENERGLRTRNIDNNPGSTGGTSKARKSPDKSRILFSKHNTILIQNSNKRKTYDETDPGILNYGIAM